MYPGQYNEYDEYEYGISGKAGSNIKNNKKEDDGEEDHTVYIRVTDKGDGVHMVACCSFGNGMLDTIIIMQIN